MKHIVITGNDYKEVSTEDLHNAIKAEVGENFAGLSVSPEYPALAADGQTVLAVIPASIALHFEDAVTGTEMGKARRLYDEHDINNLPPKPPVKSLQDEVDELKTILAQLLAGKSPQVIK